MRGRRGIEDSRAVFPFGEMGSWLWSKGEFAIEDKNASFPLAAAKCISRGIKGIRSDFVSGIYQEWPSGHCHRLIRIGKFNRPVWSFLRVITGRSGRGGTILKVQRGWVAEFGSSLAFQVACCVCCPIERWRHGLLRMLPSCPGVFRSLGFMGIGTLQAAGIVAAHGVFRGVTCTLNP